MKTSPAIDGAMTRTIEWKYHQRLLERVGSQDQWCDPQERTSGTHHHRRLLVSLSIWDSMDKHC